LFPSLLKGCEKPSEKPAEEPVIISKAPSVTCWSQSQQKQQHQSFQYLNQPGNGYQIEITDFFRLSTNPVKNIVKKALEKPESAVI
jgi:hypothetical protein